MSVEPMRRRVERSAALLSATVTVSAVKVGGSVKMAPAFALALAVHQALNVV